MTDQEPSDLDLQEIDRILEEVRVSTNKTVEEMINSHPPEARKDMAKFLLKRREELGMETYEKIKADAEAFKASLEPPTTAARSQEVAEEVNKVKEEIVKEFDSLDNDELRFLKRYIQMLGMKHWDAAHRLQYIDFLINWAYEDQETFNTIQARLDGELEEAERRVEELKKEREAMTADRLGW